MLELLVSISLVLLTGCSITVLLITVGQRRSKSSQSEAGEGGGSKVGNAFRSCCGTLCRSCHQDSINPENNRNAGLNQYLLGNASPRPPQHYRPKANQQKIESQAHYSSVALTTSNELSSSHYSVVDYSDDMQGRQLIKPPRNEKSSHKSKHAVRTAAPSKLPPQAQPGYYNIRPAAKEELVYSNVTTDPQGNFQRGDYETEANNASQEGVYEQLSAAYEFDSSMPVRSIDEEEDFEDGKEENYPYSYAHVGALEVVGDNTDYTEPAQDENSLYAQLKLLNVKIVKKITVELGSYLGSGQFGTVYKGVLTAQDKTTEVAIKTLNPNPHVEDKVRFLQEAAIMGQFKHPNVVKMYGVVTEEEPFMIVLELLTKGDLRKCLMSLKPQADSREDHLPSMLLRFCQQIALGMHYLSKKGFVHRDLAARNILVSEDGHCKVADFGMSRDLAQEDYYISHGGQIPVKWTAPEAMHFRKYSTASDVWSFGVVMYEIWSMGHKPFEEYTNPKALSLVDSGIRLASPPGCPREIYAFMIKCWNPVSSSRPSFDEAVKYLFRKESDLLKWSVKDKAVHLSACKLGASLEVSKHLHRDLRDTYLKKS